MTWYDGGKKPSQDLARGEQLSGGGVIIACEKGTLYVPGEHGGGAHLVGGAPVPDVDFEKSPGHFEEFVRAIEGGKPAQSNFPDYAVPLTETVLLGNLAVWAPGRRLEWEHGPMSVRGSNEFNAIIRPQNREGWRL
jgi:hypothetical protein